VSKFKIGDKVRIVADHVWGEELGNVGVVSNLVGVHTYVVTREGDVENYFDGFNYSAQDLELIEEENEMKLWQDMTPEQKGALLLAYHEGKVIEYLYAGQWVAAIRPYWCRGSAYRVKPEPVVKTKELFGGYSAEFDNIGFFQNRYKDAAHKITFNVVDGEIDVTSIKMEKL